MDDPMIRPRLDRINGTRPLGALDPKPEPPPFFHPTFCDCLTAINLAG